MMDSVSNLCARFNACAYSACPGSRLSRESRSCHVHKVYPDGSVSRFGCLIAVYTPIAGIYGQEMEIASYVFPCNLLNLEEHQPRNNYCTKRYTAPAYETARKKKHEKKMKWNETPNSIHDVLGKCNDQVHDSFTLLFAPFCTRA